MLKLLLSALFFLTAVCTSFLAFGDTMDLRLHKAAATGDVAAIQQLLDSGAAIETQDAKGATPLLVATHGNRVDAARALIEAGVNVDHVNRLGWTALIEAIILGDGGSRHVEIVRLLIDSGANVNLADNDGVTPLRHARSRGYDGIVKLLEVAGAT
ncbi:ankyrin repeat protein [Rhizobium sp. ERR 922]|uniref:ankyrin repeat domain-containing protein n=1 Tax=unclassified Rhizobium TaxID=2613769 RepID=UPI0011ADC482|nr:MULTISPECIES: ankyrin repeat domain-containing protein [unclassified Rhizobium]TWB58229.1 ankyrin repeat protein [Rhizobium sp. ERR 922]TWB99924.1 ankyrin repeat protein [Rhizobium sp. ERR 942]